MNLGIGDILFNTSYLEVCEITEIKNLKDPDTLETHFLYIFQIIESYTDENKGASYPYFYCKSNSLYFSDTYIKITKEEKKVLDLIYK